MMIFEYSAAHWAAFFSAAVLLNLSPGPDIAYILGRTATGGRRAGVFAMFGIWTGAFFHVIMAAVGLSALLVASSTAFTVVKWIGAGYLIWLGLKALLSKGGGFVGQPGKAVSDGAVFQQGVLVATLNPKVAVFFLAFLPQFVVPGAGPVPAQLFLHGALIIVVAAFVETPMVLAGARLAQGLKNAPNVAVWLDRTLGALFIGLGLRLALDRS